MASPFKPLNLRTGLAGTPQKTAQPVAGFGAAPVGASPPAPAGPAQSNPFAAGSPPTSLADQLRAQSPGMEWNIQGIDRAQELGDWLGSKGVKDLANAKLVWEDAASLPEPHSGAAINESGEMAPQPVAGGMQKRGYLDFGDVRLGNEGNIHTGNGRKDGRFFGSDPTAQAYIPDAGGKNANQAFASSTKGHGAVSYQYVQGADGKLQIIPKWTSTSDMGTVRDVLKGGLALAGGFGLAGLGPLSGLGEAFGTAGAAGGGSASSGVLGGLSESVYGLGGALGPGIEAGTIGGLSGATGSFGGLGSVLPASVGFGEAGLGIGTALAGNALPSDFSGFAPTGVETPPAGSLTGPGTLESAAGYEQALPGMVEPGASAGGVFNAAKDSQLASSQLGITGAESAAAATAPASANLGSLGTYASGGGMVNNIANALEAAKVNPTGALGSAGSSIVDFAKANPGLASMGVGALGQLAGGSPSLPSQPGGSGGNSALVTALEQQIGTSGAPDYSSVFGLKNTAGDLNTLNQEAIDAAYSQQTRMLDPQFQREQQAMEARLAEQGFVPGTPGYTRAMQVFNESRNQAYGSARDSSILQGYQIGQGDARNQIADTELNNSASRESLAQVLAKRNQPFNELASLKANEQIDYNNSLDRYNAEAASSNSRNQALSQLALALGMYLG